MKRFTARLKQNWNGWGESVGVAKVYALVSWIDRKEWEDVFYALFIFMPLKVYIVFLLCFFACFNHRLIVMDFISWIYIRNAYNLISTSS